MRRFFRIAPLFYIMIIIYLIKDVLILKTFPTTAEIMANFAFIFNLYPPYFESIVTTGWTMGVEMPFYLILPLIYLGFNTIPRSLILLASTMALADIVHYLLSQFAHFLKPAYNFIYAGIASPGLAFFSCLLLTLILLTLSSLFTYRFIEEKGILYGKMLIAGLCQDHPEITS